MRWLRWFDLSVFHYISPVKDFPIYLNDVIHFLKNFLSFRVFLMKSSHISRYGEPFTSLFLSGSIWHGSLSIWLFCILLRCFAEISLLQRRFCSLYYLSSSMYFLSSWNRKSSINYFWNALSRSELSWWLSLKV